MSSVLLFFLVVGQGGGENLLKESTSGNVQVLLDDITSQIPDFINNHAVAYRSTLLGAQPITLEFNVDEKGWIDELVLSSQLEDNRQWDMIRHLISAVDPVASDGEKKRCVMRLAFKRKTMDVALGCYQDDAQLPLIAGANIDDGKPKKDLGALLFHGWLMQEKGDMMAAYTSYKRALEQTPKGSLANRAMALYLLGSKRQVEAVTHLTHFIEAQRTPSEIKKAVTTMYSVGNRRKSQQTHLAQSRPRLKSKDIGVGIQHWKHTLEPCLYTAWHSGALKHEDNKLVVSWTIQHAGTLAHINIEEPASLLMTPAAECVEKVMAAWKFNTFTEGEEVRVRSAPIQIAMTPPSPKAPPKAPKAPSPRDADTWSASVAGCVRKPEAIEAFIRARKKQVNSCVQAQRSQAPQHLLPTKFPVRFVLTSSGRIKNVTLDHRYMRGSSLEACVFRALDVALPPVSGTHCQGHFILHSKRNERDK
jgi:hypothetical protein